MSKVKKIVEAILATHSYAEATPIADASVGMMSKINQAAIRVGLTLEQLLSLSDDEISQVVYGESEPGKAQPDWEKVQQWLKVHRKVTLKMAWEKYCEENKGLDCYSYGRFCALHTIYEKGLKMVQHSNLFFWAGQRFEADYSGDPIEWTDSQGVKHVSQLFLACSTYSQAYFAFATDDQKLVSWLKGFRATFEYFEASAPQLVIDNAKALVSKVTKEGSVVQFPVIDLCNYYGVTPCPCPPGAPKCKSRVEHAVGMAQKDLIAAVKLKGGWKADSLDDLNVQLSQACDILNGRAETDGEATGKWKRFIEEKPFLIPLPAIRYEIGEWKIITADSRHCVRINGEGFHRYSVPPECAGRKMWVHILESKIVIFRYEDNQQVAIHVRHTEETGEKTHLLREHMTEREKHNGLSRREYEDALVERGISREIVSGYVAVAWSDGRHGRRIAHGALNASKEFLPAAIEYAMKKCIELGEADTPKLRKLSRDYEDGLADGTGKESNKDYHTPGHSNIRGHYE